MPRHMVAKWIKAKEILQRIHDKTELYRALLLVASCEESLSKKTLAEGPISPDVKKTKGLIKTAVFNQSDFVDVSSPTHDDRSRQKGIDYDKNVQYDEIFLHQNITIFN